MTAADDFEALLAPHRDAAARMVDAVMADLAVRTTPPPALDPGNVRAAVARAVGPEPRAPSALTRAVDHQRTDWQRQARTLGLPVVVDDAVPPGYGLVRDAAGVVTHAVQLRPSRKLGRDALTRVVAQLRADTTGERVLLVGPDGHRETIRPGTVSSC